MIATVVLADEYSVVRAGLRAWIEAASIEVVGESADGESAAELVERLSPSLLLSNAYLPRLDGLGCLGRLREKSVATPVLIYSGHNNPTHLARASALGAEGFMHKSFSREDLIDAIGSLARGGKHWPPKTPSSRETPRLASVAGGPPGATLQAPLTVREADVLRQLSFGLSNKEIGLALGIRYDTVKEHVQHILRKLAVSDRTQAAVWAVRNGYA